MRYSSLNEHVQIGLSAYPVQRVVAKKSADLILNSALTCVRS